jgi:hypothetical protein
MADDSNKRDEHGEGRPNIVERLTDPETGRPRASGGVPVQGSMRNSLDSDDVECLKAKPSDVDGRLDVNVDETFPASDPTSITQPRKGGDGPRPGGKYE